MICVFVCDGDVAVWPCVGLCRARVCPTCPEDEQCDLRARPNGTCVISISAIVKTWHCRCMYSDQIWTPSRSLGGCWYSANDEHLPMQPAAIYICVRYKFSWYFTVPPSDSASEPLPMSECLPARQPCVIITTETRPLDRPGQLGIRVLRSSWTTFTTYAGCAFLPIEGADGAGGCVTAAEAELGGVIPIEPFQILSTCSDTDALVASSLTFSDCIDAFSDIAEATGCTDTCIAELQVGFHVCDMADPANCGATDTPDDRCTVAPDGSVGTGVPEVMPLAAAAANSTSALPPSFVLPAALLIACHGICCASACSM